MSTAGADADDDGCEYLVHVEFENLDPNVFIDENLKMDMLAIDSDRPIMQINGKFFQGTYEDAVGTYLYFEEDSTPKVTDREFDKTIPKVKYFNKSNKVLRMQRVFVEPNTDVLGDSNEAKCKPNLETVREAGVPPPYQQAALDFWENARDERILAVKNYLEKSKFREELRAKGFEPESDSEDDNPFAMYKYMEEEGNEVEAHEVVLDDDETIEELIVPDKLGEEPIIINLEQPSTSKT